MTASIMALHLVYFIFELMQIGVQVPYHLQNVGHLPVFCLLHSLKLDMAGLTIEGQLLLEAPQKSLLMNKKGPMYRQGTNN